MHAPLAFVPAMLRQLRIGRRPHWHRIAFSARSAASVTRHEE
jgi:hypothetical protein